MKLLDLLAHLAVWPFDADAGNVGGAGGMPHDGISHARCAIVLPAELRPVVIAARWPSEHARRTMH
jgi:hypothetical protein